MPKRRKSELKKRATGETEQRKDRRAEETINTDGRRSIAEVAIRKKLRQKKLSISLHE